MIEVEFSTTMDTNCTSSMFSVKKVTKLMFTSIYTVLSLIISVKVARFMLLYVQYKLCSELIERGRTKCLIYCRHDLPFCNICNSNKL